MRVSRATRAFSGASIPSAPSAALSDLRRTGWQRAHLSPLLQPSTVPASPLEAAYCGTLGAEFEHCAAEERAWLAEQVEGHFPTFALSPSEAKTYWRMLASADAFEAFLSRKLATLKRYGGEGIEAQLPALHTLLAGAHACGASHAVVSSAHRGRLATQVSLLRYPARRLFWKLRGHDDIPGTHPGLDDVSSHVAVSTELHVGRPWGASSALPGAAAASASGRIRVSLLPNPSHLEAVNPVAMGKARAMQDALGAGGAARVAPICIHGDAALAGQGVVYETALLAEARGYSVGGTLHLVCNNQVGFTHQPSAAAGAFARGFGFPILHANAESPAAVVFACRLAAAFRARFSRDAVVDLVGYRRNGHNEVDEPAFTQPAMYASIRARRSHTDAYGAELEAAGVLGPGERDKHAAAAAAHLEGEWQASEPGRQGCSFSSAGGSMGGEVSSAAGSSAFSASSGQWGGYRVAASSQEAGSSPPTGVQLEALRLVGAASVALPPAPFVVHPRLQRGHVAPRLEALGVGKENSPTIDWATAEALAFGSLLREGTPVRLAGQDSERGTFSHRHAVLHCQSAEGSAGGVRHTPLAALGAPFTALSSPLTEFAALGFELGYSWESPAGLVLWEAQFGDFANGAQVVIDTFLSGGESKWLRSSGLVLLLPHGQDGAGPEHSSARVERFLGLCNSQAWAAAGGVALEGAGGGATASTGAAQWAGDKAAQEPVSMLVAQPTTPANYFHLLRRQASPARPFRKPLVLFTPKQLLRAAAATSPLADLGPGSAFVPVLADSPAAGAGAGAGAPRPPLHRLLLCSGKVYYELVARKASLVAAGHSSAGRTAIVRLEQLCPFPSAELRGVLAGLGYDAGAVAGGAQAVYVQEEPANAGAWGWAAAHWVAGGLGVGGQGLAYVGRPALAAPAVGLSGAWRAQQERLLAAAFA